MKLDPHIIVSQEPLVENTTQTVLCGRELLKAGWIRTDGDLRSVTEWMSALGRTCRKCREKFDKSTYDPVVLRVYFAIEAELLHRNGVED